MSGVDMRAKLAALLKAHEAMGAQLRDVAAAIEGEQTQGQIIRRLLKTWGDLYRQRYQAPYVFAGAKNTAQIKRLLAALPAEDVEVRMRRFMQSSDAFPTRTRHSFDAFVATVNQWAVDDGDLFAAAEDDAPTRETPAPADCAHTPRCRTAVQHTQRTLAELR